MPVAFAMALATSTSVDVLTSQQVSVTAKATNSMPWAFVADCADDADGDGICDDVDGCVGEFDGCGVCNGPGAIYEWDALTSQKGPRL